MSDDETSKRNVATAIAGVGLLLCGGALLALVSLVIPNFIYVIAVIAGMGFIGILQYVTWGWRLDKNRIRDDDPPARS